MHLHISRPQILVAEDNDTNRKVIMLQLQLLNLSAEAVPNGSEALVSLLCCRTAPNQVPA